MMRLSPTLSVGLLFSVVLFAMVGNARLFDLDVVSMILGPFCLFLFWLGRPKLSPDAVSVGIVLVLFFYVLQVISFRYDMLLGHTLWPAKALILALFVGYVGTNILVMHVHVVGVFSILLLLTSTDEFGRSYGLFGPNMLYRFYGLSFLAGIYMLAVKGGKQVVVYIYLVVSMLGIVQTGSVGGILLGIIGASLFLRFTLKSFLMTALTFAIVAYNWDKVSQIFVIERLLLKVTFDNLVSSSRLDGANRILSEGFSVFGHGYDQYRYIWGPGFDYPHNIFVELIAFYGVVGVLLCAVLILGFISTWRRIHSRKCGILDFTFVSIFVGSLLSGDLADNYGAVGIAVATVTNWWLRRRDDRLNKTARREAFEQRPV